LRTSRHGLFYGCTRYPHCMSSHGAHPNGDPLGIPANRETKAARIAAHFMFDRLWKGPRAILERGAAYRWMQEKLHLPSASCHIGKFDLATCDDLIALIQREFYYDETRSIRYDTRGATGVE